MKRKRKVVQTPEEKRAADAMRAAAEVVKHREAVDLLLNHLEEQFHDLVGKKKHAPPAAIASYLHAIHALREERQHLRS